MKRLPKDMKNHHGVRLVTVFFIGLILAWTGLTIWYQQSLKPVSKVRETVYFTITSGSGVKQIGDQLEDAKLIRSHPAFETYVRKNGFSSKLQAGTYRLSPSMSTQEIVKRLTGGDVSEALLTILPGKRLDQVKQAFTAAGYSEAEIDKAFKPSHYRSHPALAGLPKNASLEGYLYPDSYQRLATTPATDVVRLALNEMDKHLSGLRGDLKKHKLSLHEAITLASIVVEETDDVADQPTVAGVFYNRLKNDMPLGSDVTAHYAAILAGQEPNVTIDSPYNTRIYAGLPPGPISNVTVESLRAVAHPVKTDYLYFLFGDDNKMHYAKTQAGHEQNIVKYCQVNCSQ